MILLPLLLAGAAPQASPTPELPTLFGLPLGEPVALPECERASLGGGKRSAGAYAERQASTCQGLPGIEYPSRPTSGSITFAKLKVPWFLAGARAETVVIDGKLEALIMPTLPLPQAQGLAMELINKFGQPTQNGLDTSGGRMPTLRMVWDRPDYTAEYTASTAFGAGGRLIVESTKARALRLGGDAKADAERTRL